MTTQIDIITSLNAAAGIAARRARRLSWMALAMGIVGLALLVVASAVGYAAPWTSWLLVTVLTTNPAVYLLSQRWGTHRAARIYYGTATLATFVTCVGVVIRLWHQ